MHLDPDTVGVLISILLLWGRVEHRFTKLETRIDYLEEPHQKRPHKKSNE